MSSFTAAFILRPAVIPHRRSVQRVAFRLPSLNRLAAAAVEIPCVKSGETPVIKGVDDSVPSLLHVPHIPHFTPRFFVDRAVSQFQASFFVELDRLVQRFLHFGVLVRFFF